MVLQQRIINRNNGCRAAVRTAHLPQGFYIGRLIHDDKIAAIGFLKN